MARPDPSSQVNPSPPLAAAARRMGSLGGALILLAGCASAPESGRSQFAPSSLAPVSAAYSEMEMATRLAFSDERACKADDCAGHFAFRRRVAAVAARLEKAALALYRDLPGGLPKFHVRVVLKDEAGSLSSAMGTLVVLDGLRTKEADDAALALVVAREMGHVIGRHHEENSATGLVISVLAQLLLPVANLVRGTAVAIQGGTAAVATTAASMAGTKAVLATYRPDQLREADAIAFRLLAQAGWQAGEVAAGGRALAAKLGDAAWAADLRAAVGRFDAILAGPPADSDSGLRMAVALTPPGE